MKTVDPVHSHDDRPSVRQAFPVRCVRDPRDNLLKLKWEERGDWDGRTVHTELVINLEAADLKVYIPQGVIMKMLERYHELGAEVDGVMKERDEAVTELQVAKGTIEDLEKRLAGYKNAGIPHKKGVT